MKIKLNKAQYIKGDIIELDVLTNEDAGELQIKVYQRQSEMPCSIEQSRNKNTYHIKIRGLAQGAYIACIASKSDHAETAFDIVESRTTVVRYGFLTEFEGADNGDIAIMKEWHLNAVQFYDWMYRHDHLVSEEDEYLEPLGRKINKTNLQKKIEECTNAGMRPIAYGAVYAATKDTFEKHPEWSLYTMDGEAMLFANWLYYMNIAEGFGWKEHILNEYKEAVEKMGFQGIHMDTYGFPKNVFDSKGNKINLADYFKPLIDEAALLVKNINAENGVIFNAVNNWPIENVAESRQDAVYIEVWSPNDQYADLYRLIRNARQLSGKNVVLAAYMKPFQEAAGEEAYEKAEISYLLTNAVICASGGTQLALGGNSAILCDSYYVKHAKLREEFLPTVKKYCDYLVAYSDFMYNDNGKDVSMTASGGVNEDIIFVSGKTEFSATAQAGKVWTIIREQENRLTIHLINLTNNNGCWNEAKEKPEKITDICMKFRYDRKLASIYTASPDADTIMSALLDSTVLHGNCGRTYVIHVPELFVWRTIVIEME